MTTTWPPGTNKEKHSLDGCPLVFDFVGKWVQDAIVVPGQKPHEREADDCVMTVLYTGTGDVFSIQRLGCNDKKEVRTELFQITEKRELGP